MVHTYNPPTNVDTKYRFPTPTPKPTVSKIYPGKYLIGQGHYGKVKSRSQHEVAHLHLQPMSLQSINLQFPRYSLDKIFKLKVTMAKVKSRSHHYAAQLYPLTNVPTKYKLPTSHSLLETAWTNFFPLPARLPECPSGHHG